MVNERKQYTRQKRSSKGFNKNRSKSRKINASTHIARLKLLFIAAKVVKDQNRDKVKYSIHDARTPAMVGLLAQLVPIHKWHLAAQLGVLTRSKSST